MEGKAIEQPARATKRIRVEDDDDEPSALPAPRRTRRTQARDANEQLCKRFAALALHEWWDPTLEWSKQWEHTPTLHIRVGNTELLRVTVPAKRPGYPEGWTTDRLHEQELNVRVLHEDAANILRALKDSDLGTVNLNVFMPGSGHRVLMHLDLVHGGDRAHSICRSLPADCEIGDVMDCLVEEHVETKRKMRLHHVSACEYSSKLHALISDTQWRRDIFDRSILNAYVKLMRTA